MNCFTPYQSKVKSRMSKVVAFEAYFRRYDFRLSTKATKGIV